MNKFFSKQSLQILVTFGLWAFFLTWYFLVILWNVLHLYVFPDLYIPQVVSAFTKHVGLTIFIFLAFLFIGYGIYLYNKRKYETELKNNIVKLFVKAALKRPY